MAWPKLSATLPHKGGPSFCQQCRAVDRVDVWIEHDECDQPTPIMISLCERCAGMIIEPHPRLYAQAPANAPIPGAMTLCGPCHKRDGLRCTMARTHGGPGITVTAAKPFVTHIDGRDKAGKRFGRWLHCYSSPPSDCSGRVVPS